MSLLGRLEDLSLPDIVQIVYLSRRTGMLEIVDEGQRWGIYFVNGLVASAFAPHDENLLDFIVAGNAISGEQIARLRSAVDEGAVIGDLIVSSELMSAPDLAELIRLRITRIVRPLLTRRTGEFNFFLSESIGPREIGYEIETLFRQGGILPSEVLDEEDKAKPLQSLEETMRAGKALLKGESGTDVSAFGFGEEIEEMTARSQSEEADEAETPFDEPDEDDTFAELSLDTDPSDLLEEEQWEAPATDDAPFGAQIEDGKTDDLSDLLADESSPESPTRGRTEPESADLTAAERAETEPDAVVPARPLPPHPPPSPPFPSREAATPEKIGSMTAPPQARPSSGFRVGAEQEGPVEDRNVVLFERNPMIRVAAKRAFGQSKFQIFQFGRMDEAQKTVNEMLEANRFFVSFLELDPGAEQITSLLLHQIKRTNRHLPVVVIDAEASLERRHDLLKGGADMYLTKPSPAHLRPEIADQTLRMFADELVQFAEHAVQNWERLTETYGQGDGAVGATLYEIADRERLNRTRSLMRSLINELADPDDINQLAQTILRLADEYLDRAALFAASPTRFIGLGGFGPTGIDREMDQLVRGIRIARDDDSVLRDVIARRAPHRGKLRRTAANVKLLRGIGAIQPTQVIAIPIDNDGAPVGVLYGDNAGQRSPIGKTSGLEIFLEQAGLALHNAVVTNARRKGLDWDTR